MAEFALGEADLAAKNLTDFLKYYHENDGWTQARAQRSRRLRRADDRGGLRGAAPVPSDILPLLGAVVIGGTAAGFLAATPLLSSPLHRGSRPRGRRRGAGTPYAGMSRAAEQVLVLQTARMCRLLGRGSVRWSRSARSWCRRAARFMSGAPAQSRRR